VKTVQELETFILFTAICVASVDHRGIHLHVTWMNNGLIQVLNLDRAGGILGFRDGLGIRKEYASTDTFMHVVRLLVPLLGPFKCSLQGLDFCIKSIKSWCQGLQLVQDLQTCLISNDLFDVGLYKSQVGVRRSLDRNWDMLPDVSRRLEIYTRGDDGGRRCLLFFQTGKEISS
jgi:hypothetical protein